MYGLKLMSRRSLFRSSASAAVVFPGLKAYAAQGAAGGGADAWRGLKVGVASYTFRKFPLEATIRGIQRVGLRYVSIKDFHLPRKSTAEERRAVAQKFKDAGITPLSCGNISMENDDETSMRRFVHGMDRDCFDILCAGGRGR